MEWLNALSQPTVKFKEDFLAGFFFFEFQFGEKSEKRNCEWKLRKTGMFMFVIFSVSNGSTDFGEI